MGTIVEGKQFEVIKLDAVIATLALPYSIVNSCESVVVDSKQTPVANSNRKKCQKVPSQ